MTNELFGLFLAGTADRLLIGGQWPVVADRLVISGLLVFLEI